MRKRSKEIEKGINLLMENYNYTREEVISIFDMNEIVSIFDSETLKDNSVHLNVIEENTKTYAEKQEFDLVKSFILKTCNGCPAFIHYYNMLGSNIYYVNRKVMYQEKRYNVICSNGKTLYLTDNSCIKIVSTDEVKVVIEDLNFKETYEFVVLVYQQMLEFKPISLVKFVAIFVDIYDLNYKKLISSLNPEMKDTLMKEIKSFTTKNNLGYDFGRAKI